MDQKNITIKLTQQKTEYLLQGLNKLDNKTKTNIVYQELIKELGTMQTLFNRIIKNEKIIQAIKRENNKKPTTKRK